MLLCQALHFLEFLLPTEIIVVNGLKNTLEPLLGVLGWLRRWGGISRILRLFRQRATSPRRFCFGCYTRSQAQDDAAYEDRERNRANDHRRLNFLVYQPQYIPPLWLVS